MHFGDRLWNGQTKLKYYEMFANGHDAVSFFFVLSGFVLSYKYIVLKHPLKLQEYYISRVFRLLPAYFVAVLASALYTLHWKHQTSLNDLLDVFLGRKGNFWEEAILIKPVHDFYFPGWTLTIEFLASLMLPFFMVVAMKNRKLLSALLLVWVFVIGENFLFLQHFLLGLLICSYFNELQPTTFQHQTWYKFRYLLLLVAILLWPLRYYAQLVPFGSWYGSLCAFTHWSEYTVTAFCSALFLTTILFSLKTQAFLSRGIFVFLGKISFSIYLTHILAIAWVFDSLIPDWGAANGTLKNIEYVTWVGGLTLVYSLIMYHAIEKPSIALGKRINARLSAGKE